MPLEEVAEWLEALPGTLNEDQTSNRRAGDRRPGRAHPAAGDDRGGLPEHGARHAQPVGGGGPAAAAGCAARVGADRGAVRAGRADHWAAPARHHPPDRGAAPTARPGQHRAGDRARPGDDPGGRSRGRVWPRRGQARRAGGGPRDARRGGAEPGLTDGELPLGAAAAAGASAAQAATAARWSSAGRASTT